MVLLASAETTTVLPTGFNPFPHTLKTRKTSFEEQQENNKRPKIDRTRKGSRHFVVHLLESARPTPASNRARPSERWAGLSRTTRPGTRKGRTSPRTARSRHAPCETGPSSLSFLCQRRQGFWCTVFWWEGKHTAPRERKHKNLGLQPLGRKW